MAPSGRVPAACLAVAGLVFIGCGDDDPPVSDVGTYAVGTMSASFVDESRGTPAVRGLPASPTRLVVTDLWYPAEGDASAPPSADAPSADGPFPLIVFNHGQQGEPAQYAPSFELWASAGYVVAAPRHPLTVRGGPGVRFAEDAEGEIGDIPFVISMVTGEFGDLADADRLAVAGHSSGAIASYMVTFDECCRDDRVDALVVNSLAAVAADGEPAEGAGGTPTLFVHGTADQNPIEGPRAVYAEADEPKFFLTVEGGDHSMMYRDGPAAPAVAAATLAFFDLVLKGHGDAADRLRDIEGMEADID